MKYIQAGIKLHGLTTYKEAWLSHCPIHEQELRKKILNIHGHTHNHNIGKDTRHYDSRGDIIWYKEDKRYFNVSCENINYKPIRYDEIIGRVL